MKSIEKPFNYLSEKEKQILELCREIILWGTDSENARNPHSLELKEKATALYDYLSGMDVGNDDKYYKLYEKYGQLKNEFDKLKNSDNYVNAEIEGNPQELFKKIKLNFESGNNVILNRDWPCDQEKYGDYLVVTINQFNKEVELIIHEMFDGYVYENSLINEIKKVFEDLKLKYDYSEHEHGSTIEYNLKCNAKKIEELEELLASIFEITGKTERILKKH